VQRTRSQTQKQLSFPVQENQQNELLGQIEEAESSVQSETEPAEDDFEQLPDPETKSRPKSEVIEAN
jgi:hypothetical protein